MRNLKTKKNRKGAKEERSSSNIISSYIVFKVEAKVDIKPYQGEIDDVKLNQWL